jgi:hypothetical protein
VGEGAAWLWAPGMWGWASCCCGSSSSPVSSSWACCAFEEQKGADGSGARVGWLESRVPRWALLLLQWPLLLLLLLLWLLLLLLPLLLTVGFGWCTSISGACCRNNEEGADGR